MIRDTDVIEKLYLSKSPDEIYIDNCNIPQHQIDGIRFLYRQYKKNKAGVIINDTTGCDKNLQIVLFLKAMCGILKQPALILCQEGAEQGWMEQFHRWTDLSDEVVLETKKPHIKKQVLINTMSNLSSFCKREWSVLIVDLPEIDKTTAGLRFNADYKIWITPIDMKENLDQFSKIYKWLYPTGEFHINDFISDKHTPSDLIDKAILLDAFMEDIVARNGDIQSSTENNTKFDISPKRISLRNKDATGTKIKRSKRKIYDDEDDDNNSGVKNTAINHDAHDAVSKGWEITDDFTIDNFKRKRKELNQNVPTSESDTEIKMETLNSQSQVKLIYEPDSLTDVDSDRLYEMDTLEFGDDTVYKQSINVNESMNTIMETNEDNSEVTNTYLGSNDETNNDYGLDTQEDSKHLSNNDISTQSPTIFEMKSENYEINEENNIQDDDRMSVGSPSICDDIKPNSNELETHTEPSVSDKIESCHNLEPVEIILKTDIEIDNKITPDKVHIESDNNELSKENNAVTNKMVEPVTNTATPKCIDEKLKELEERVMKKFKGSILESLI